MANALLFLWLAAAVANPDLEKARDAQDRPGLDRLAAQFSAAAQKQPADAAAQYWSALAESYLAEVGTETGDKNFAHTAAETGIKAAERAVALKADTAEYHRVLGTLCGQAVAANVLAGLKYAHCAMD